MDMHACTDACIYSNQDVGLEEGCMGHVCGTIQGHTCLHTTMQRGSQRDGKAGAHAYMY